MTLMSNMSDCPIYIADCQYIFGAFYMIVLSVVAFALTEVCSAIFSPKFVSTGGPFHV